MKTKDLESLRAEASKPNYGSKYYGKGLVIKLIDLVLEARQALAEIAQQLDDERAKNSNREGDSNPPLPSQDTSQGIEVPVSQDEQG